MLDIIATDFPLACCLVPSITLDDSFFERVGAYSFVQGNFKAGPNCSSICFIPPFPPAK